MTGNCKSEAGQLVDTAEGEEETSNPKWGESNCHTTRRHEFSVGSGGSGGNNTASDLKKAVKFAQCARDNSMKDLPDAFSSGSVDLSPSLGTHPQSSTVQEGESACQSLMPGGSSSSGSRGPTDGT